MTSRVLVSRALLPLLKVRKLEEENGVGDPGDPNGCLGDCIGASSRLKSLLLFMNDRGNDLAPLVVHVRFNIWFVSDVIEVNRLSNTICDLLIVSVILFSIVLRSSFIRRSVACEHTQIILCNNVILYV